MAARKSANSDTFKVTTPTERSIVMTRRFDAPRHLVFEVMTKPEHVKRWWGILDEEHSVPVCEIDLRVGGAWRFVNRFSRGEVTFYGVYREIMPPSRLVFTEIFAQYPEAESLVTTTLEDDRGQTLVTITCEYPTQEARDAVVSSGMERGAALSYDQLEAVARELHEAR